MFRDLRADEIECRVAQAKENGVSLLLYKDARCDQSILDETVGAMNWQRHHCRENANCIVSIWDNDKQIWVSKEDTGTESNTEKEKGLASDSFKRACFNWGIGRELYTAPFIWIKAEACAALKDSIDPRTKEKKWKCNDNFSVDSIEIRDKQIVSLAIKNVKTGNVCFTWSKGTPPSEPKTPPQDDNYIYRCENCGEVVKGYITENGTVIGVRRHANGSKKKYNKVLCLPCIEKMNAEAEVAADENTD